MSGDLLEDLMSSEGQFNRSKVFTECESVWFSCAWHLLLSPFPLQCSRPSSVCPLHPATTIIYTTWTRQKASVTFSMSPFSTSDLWGRCRGGKRFLKRFLSTFIFSKISPHSLKVRGGAAEPLLSDEHSRTPLHWLSELSQTVGPHKASWRNTGKNKTF